MVSQSDEVRQSRNLPSTALMQVRAHQNCALGVAPYRSHTDAIEKHVAEMACICNLQAYIPRLSVIHESHLASDITLLYQMYYHLEVI